MKTAVKVAHTPQLSGQGPLCSTDYLKSLLRGPDHQQHLNTKLNTSLKPGYYYKGKKKHLLIYKYKIEEKISLKK